MTSAWCKTQAPYALWDQLSSSSSGGEITSTQRRALHVGASLARFETASPTGPLSLAGKLHWTQARRAKFMGQLALETDANLSMQLLRSFGSEMGASTLNMATDPVFFADLFIGLTNPNPRWKGSPPGRLTKEAWTAIQCIVETRLRKFFRRCLVEQTAFANERRQLMAMPDLDKDMVNGAAVKVGLSTFSTLPLDDVDLAARQIHDFIEALAEANFDDNKGAASAVPGPQSLMDKEAATMVPLTSPTHAAYFFPWSMCIRLGYNGAILKNV